MNCQEFELSVRDLVRSEVGERTFEASLGTNEQESALVHVERCEACAQRLQDERALSRRLDALSTEMMSLAPSARIEAELLQAFRQTITYGIPGSAGILPASSIQRKSSFRTKSGQDAHAPRRLSGQDARAPRRPGATAYWLTAVAAVLLIVFGIVLVRAKLSATKSIARQPVEAGVPRQAPVPDERTGGKGSVESIPVNVPSDEDELAVHQRKRPRHLRRLPVNRDGDVDASLSALSAGLQPTEEQTEPEVTTQFIALSYVAPANLQDGGQIVRVELPRSAMASFGLPVNMDRFGERVKADVLVSADGFARAIRFVQ